MEIVAQKARANAVALCAVTVMNQTAVSSPGCAGLPVRNCGLSKLTFGWLLGVETSRTSQCCQAQSQHSVFTLSGVLSSSSHQLLPHPVRSSASLIWSCNSLPSSISQTSSLADSQSSPVTSPAKCAWCVSAHGVWLFAAPLQPVLLSGLGISSNHAGGDLPFPLRGL